MEVIGGEFGTCLLVIKAKKIIARKRGGGDLYIVFTIAESKIVDYSEKKIPKGGI